MLARYKLLLRWWELGEAEESGWVLSPGCPRWEHPGPMRGMWYVHHLVTPVLLIHKHQTPRTAWIIIFINILIPEVSGQCQCQVISKINTYLTLILSERHNNDIKRPSYPTHSCNVEMSAAAAASSSVITRCHQTPGSLASACHQDVISLVRCSAGPDPGWVLHSKVPTPIPASWVACPESWISEASI